MRNLRSIACVLIVTSLGVFVDAGNDTDELLAVVIFYRHGDRSLKSSFPSDENFNLETFPMGYGQLTNQGIDRQHKLGQWLRNRYSNFLPEIYSPSDIYVFSTDTDRTLMSAPANLAGLYPPKSNQIWNGQLAWRPIPVHSKPEEEDEVFAMKRECAKFDKLHKKVKKNDYYTELNEKYADLYEFLTNKTGTKVKDIKQVKDIRSIIYVYDHYNASLVPSWVSSVNLTLLDYLTGLQRARKTSSTDLQRLRTGPFFYYLTSFFNNVTDNVANTPKFIMLSGHESEVASILDTMGAFDYYPPNFAATIIWEMRRSASGKDYINLFYKKSDTEVLGLNVAGCDFDCNYEDFVKILDPIIIKPKKWLKECD